MYSITVYEATNPSGAIFTARMEGRSCKGEGRTISDALRDLADDLEGAKSEAATKARLDAANFVSESQMPSCTACGAVTKPACPECGNGLGDVHPAIITAEISKRAVFEAVLEKLKEVMAFRGVAATPVSGFKSPESAHCVEQPTTERDAANAYQVGGSHYRSEIQHWDYVIANNIPYLEAQVIKYLTRWRKKNGMEDVLKSKHYLDKLIEIETSRETKRKGADTTMRGAGC